MAENMKALSEQRAAKQAEMKTLIEGAKAENRALTEEESASFAALEADISAIDGTVDAEKRALALEQRAAQTAEVPAASTKAGESTAVKEAEQRAFVNYIKSKCGVAVPEVRSGEQNFTVANNGAVIPTSIANMIISEVKEMCPILQGVTMYSVKGTLKVPVYGKANTTHDISVGYAEELTELTADAGKFTSVDLTGYLCGAVTLVGKSVIANSDIDIMGFIVREIAKKVALFIEKELLIGTENKATGALSTTNTLNAGSVSAISADNLIDLQSKVPTVYQSGACWTVNPATFNAIRKLKDATGRYLLQTEAISNGFPYTLLGKPVYISDNMPAIESAAKAVLYGDYSGLSVNFRQQIETQVINETYAAQHAIGINTWFEFDAKVTDNQKLAVLVMSV